MTLLDDLDRYNDDGLARGNLAYWKCIAAQAYTHPGLFAVVVYRFGQRVRNAPLALRLALELPYQLLYALVRFLLQVEVPRGASIGPGFRIDHYGGIVINSGAVIGRNFSASKGLNIGATDTGVPRIGDDVHCGVGVTLIGGITLGDCMKIGAGSVVTRSFPDGHAVIAGVPARFLRRLDTPPNRNGSIGPPG